MSYPLTERLGEFIASLQFNNIPEEALSAARLGFTDSIGCMIGGRDLPETTVLLQALNPRSDRGAAHVIFTPRLASVEDAALINGAAAHALDLDDVALRGSHPSAVLMPAIIAQAEALGSSGREMLTAYVAGFETWSRIIERESDSYVPKGWHMTSVIGPVAAAAALASLRKLSPRETQHALAIAASCSAGTVAGWTGTKPFQVGRAAQSGVVAAKLASGGVTGSPVALEARNGLLAALSPKGNVNFESDFEDFGQVWRLSTHGLHTKMFPYILGIHRALDGVLDLVIRYDLSPDNIENIKLRLGPTQAYYRAVAERDGESSGSWVWLAVASAIIMRRATLAERHPDFYNRADVQRIKSLITIEESHDIPADPEPNLGFSRSVTIRTNSGKTVSSEPLTFYPGHWTRRMTPNQIEEKFEYMAGEAVRQLGLSRLFKKLQNMELIVSACELFK